MDTVVLLAEEAHSEGGLPALGWGIGAFGILLLLLTLTWVFGRGRPHA